MSRRLGTMRGTVMLRGSVLVVALATLTACSEGQMPAFMQPKDITSDETVARASTSLDGGATIERDVEAPDIFAAKEAGLWDGRPSLGGVWVAHPDVTEPERAIIRNEQNGKFVIGALFRRERTSPGPRVQVSSDAAAALGILAGQPSNLDVVALRREEVAVEPVNNPPSATDDTLADIELPPAPEVTGGALDPIVSGAAAAIESAPLETASLEPPTAPAPKPAAPQPTAAGLSKPFVQIGIFSIEKNARDTATAMRQAGMVPMVKEQSSSGKTFWRVIVGPAQNKSELTSLLKSIKSTGFTDAYAVSN